MDLIGESEPCARRREGLLVARAATKPKAHPGAGARLPEAENFRTRGGASALIPPMPQVRSERPGDCPTCGKSARAWRCAGSCRRSRRRKQSDSRCPVQALGTTEPLEVPPTSVQDCGT